MEPPEPKEGMPPKIQYQERFKAVGRSLKELSGLKVEETRRNLASRLHEDWRQGYIKDNRTGEGPDDYKPRWKAAGNDEAWLARAQTDESIKRIYRKNPDTGADEADIAHASYDQLPDKWQKENRDAASFAVDYIHSAATTGRSINDEFLEEAASAVHDAWRKRNDWVMAEDQRDNPQRLDYSDPKFPESEKDKDREQVVLATEYCTQARILEGSQIEQASADGSEEQLATMAGRELSVEEKRAEIPTAYGDLKTALSNCTPFVDALAERMMPGGAEFLGRNPSLRQALIDAYFSDITERDAAEKYVDTPISFKKGLELTINHVGEEFPDGRIQDSIFVKIGKDPLRQGVTYVAIPRLTEGQSVTDDLLSVRALEPAMENVSRDEAIKNNRTREHDENREALEFVRDITRTINTPPLKDIPPETTP